MENLFHLLLNVGLLIVASLLLAYALEFARLAGGGYHLDQVALAVWPLLLGTMLHRSNPSWSWGAALLLACAASALLKFITAYLILIPIRSRAGSSLPILLASFCLLELYSFGAAKLLTTQTVPPLIQKQYLIGSLLSNHHVIGAGVAISSLVFVYWLSRRCFFGALNCLHDSPEHLLLFGYNLEGVRVLGFAVASLFSTLSGFTYSLSDNGLSLKSTPKLLLISFIVALPATRRRLMLPLLAATLIASTDVLWPYFFPSIYAGLALVSGVSILLFAYLVTAPPYTDLEDAT